MAGPDVLRQLAERAVVAELAAAAAADAVDDHERFEDHMMEAGTVLAQLFAHDPPGVPHVLEAVLTHGPLVRRGDVLAAAHLDRHAGDPMTDPGRPFDDREADGV